MLPLPLTGLSQLLPHADTALISQTAGGRLVISGWVGKVCSGLDSKLRAEVYSTLITDPLVLVIFLLPVRVAILRIEPSSPVHCTDSNGIISRPLYYAASIHRHQTQPGVPVEGSCDITQQ